MKKKFFSILRIIEYILTKIRQVILIEIVPGIARTRIEMNRVQIIHHPNQNQEENSEDVMINDQAARRVIILREKTQIINKEASTNHSTQQDVTMMIANLEIHFESVEEKSMNQIILLNMMISHVMVPIEVVPFSQVKTHDKIRQEKDMDQLSTERVILISLIEKATDTIKAVSIATEEVWVNEVVTEVVTEATILVPKEEEEEMKGEVVLVDLEEAMIISRGVLVLIEDVVVIAKALVKTRGLVEALVATTEIYHSQVRFEKKIFI